MFYFPHYYTEKKEEIWLSPMTKAPSPTEMSKGQSDNTYNVTKKFDCIAVADRLRTVSWSNYRHWTGVVNLVYGPNLPTPRNSRVIKKGHTFKNFVNKPPYIDNKPTTTPSGEESKPWQNSFWHLRMRAVVWSCLSALRDIVKIMLIILIYMYHTRSSYIC